jgi:UDP-N-acetylglucosamine--N-acetylmuramyl-(pentapeptide) pyrophosphoryl-undecaprenol N-acetylglucosamine transferase
MKIVIVAGGTGGHIFPALSVALEFKKKDEELSIVWIGTSRSRERELCDKHDIPLKILDVAGVNRSWSISNLNSLVKFMVSIFHMRSFFKKNRPDAVIAFGGYVCAPVLVAARFCRIPYFLQEQNSVPGLVNRLFSSGARCSFLGFPINGKWKLKGKSEIIGTPVRSVNKPFDDFDYPKGFDRSVQALLICGGSQGAASMNDILIEPVKKILEHGIQVIWQTGPVSFEKISSDFSDYTNVFIFESFDDLYPYYAAVKLIVGRAGASTLNEAAYFGVPVILIPLPWAAENHQWINAGYVESNDWGIRIEQNENCGKKVEKEVINLLSDTKRYEKMCIKALNNSPVDSSAAIVEKVMKEIG